MKIKKFGINFIIIIYFNGLNLIRKLINYRNKNFLLYITKLCKFALLDLLRI